jgi:hypothetical protein
VQTTLTSNENTNSRADGSLSLLMYVRQNVDRVCQTGKL